MTRDAVLEDAILTAITAAGDGKTVGPADVAKTIDAENWRKLLKPLKRVSQDLAKAGKIGIYRKGKIISPAEMKGVTRLGHPGSILVPDEVNSETE